MVYSNINDDAPWRPTEFVRDPWDVEPALMKLVGFSVRMVSLDIMHAFHLGIGRDIVGASIKILCKSKNHFLGRNIALRLSQLMKECKAYARTACS